MLFPKTNRGTLSVYFLRKKSIFSFIFDQIGWGVIGEIDAKWGWGTFKIPTKISTKIHNKIPTKIHTKISTKKQTKYLTRYTHQNTHKIVHTPTKWADCRNIPDRGGKVLSEVWRRDASMLDLKQRVQDRETLWNIVRHFEALWTIVRHFETLLHIVKDCETFWEMGNKLSGPKRLIRWSPKVACKSWKCSRFKSILLLLT